MPDVPCYKLCWPGIIRTPLRRRDAAYWSSQESGDVMASIRGMASMQDNRYDIVGDICAVQCIIIKHGYAHSGLNDDRGGHFVGAV